MANAPSAYSTLLQRDGRPLFMARITGLNARPSPLDLCPPFDSIRVPSNILLQTPTNIT